MAIFVTAVGSGGTAGEVDGTTFRSMIVTFRPAEYKGFGHYRIFAVSGVIGAAAIGSAGGIIAVRHADSQRLAVITDIAISIGHLAAASGAALGTLEIAIYRNNQTAFTGGTSADLSKDTGKQRTAMNSSLLTQIMFPTTTAITTVTADIDTQGIADVSVASWTGAITLQLSGTNIPLTRMLDDNAFDELMSPVILNQNEAIVLRAAATGTPPWGALLTTKAGLSIQWHEMMGF